MVMASSVLKNVNYHTVGRFYIVVKTCLREWCPSFKHGKRLDPDPSILSKDPQLTIKSNVDDMTVSEL